MVWVVMRGGTCSVCDRGPRDCVHEDAVDLSICIDCAGKMAQVAAPLVEEQVAKMDAALERLDVARR